MSLRYGSEARHNFNNTTGTTINAIVGVPGQRVFIYRFIATVSAACLLQLQDTNSNVMSQSFNLAATGGISLDVPFNLDPWWFTGQWLLQNQAAGQQGGLSNPTGVIQQGQGLGVNIILSTSVTTGWDIWYDYHA